MSGLMDDSNYNYNKEVDRRLGLAGVERIPLVPTSLIIGIPFFLTFFLSFFVHGDGKGVGWLV